jgi:hypothetical protein
MICYGFHRNCDELALYWPFEMQRILSAYARISTPKNPCAYIPCPTPDKAICRIEAFRLELYDIALHLPIGETYDLQRHCTWRGQLTSLLVDPTKSWMLS